MIRTLGSGVQKPIARQSARSVYLPRVTCIVALKAKKGTCHQVVMAGDSAGVSHLDVTVRKDSKVFRNGEFLIGYTDSFRMGQLLRFKFRPPPPVKRKDLFEYMCTLFVDEVRRTLKEGGFSEIDNNVEQGGNFLVGFRGRVFEVASDFQVGEAALDFAAIGCGDSYALGALAASALTDPEERVLQALAVAEKFSGGVRAPFLVLRA